jgi:NADPH:quinone reductase-like Zn-dependent oxidoreductase
MSQVNSSRAIGGIAAAIAAIAVTAVTAAPTEMKAILQAGTGGRESLIYKSVPVPSPGENQVLVKIYAASINPVDWKNRSGMFAGPRGGGGGGEGQPTVTAATPENTRIPGSDAAGVIDQVGPGVTQFKVGDAVIASIGRGGAPAGVLNGAYAQYAVAAVGSVNPKPKTMTYAQAAGLGTATSTGVGAVISANISAGQRVLVLGAAGGVGSAAAQAAKARGATVIGTASTRHAAYLKSLGVEHVDYTKGDWTSQIHDIDVAIDTVSSENATKAIATLKKGGKLLAFAGRPDAAVCAAATVDCGSQGGNRGPAPGPGAAGGAGGPAAGVPAPSARGGGAGPGGGQTQAEIIKLVDAGQLKINVDETFPLEKAYDAQEKNRTGGTEGKIVLIVDAANATRR